MLALNFSTFPVLSTERLLLRKIQEDDIDNLFKMRSNAEVMKYVDKPLAKTKADAKALYDNMATMLHNNTAIGWAIQLKEDKEMIGHIGFWRIDATNHRAEIGYILQQEHAGKGYAGEAIQATLQHAFSNLRLHSIQAVINPANIASRKLLIKNGFVQEGYFKEDYFFNGRFLDSEIYSLLSPHKPA